MAKPGVFAPRKTIRHNAGRRHVRLREDMAAPAVAALEGVRAAYSAGLAMPPSIERIELGAGLVAYSLADKVVLITGASGGIGRACAVAFFQAGAKVVATARSFDKLESLARQLDPSRVLPIRLDVTDTGQRAAAIAEARQRFGRIDVLVNNAGWASFAAVVNTPPEHVERMLALNFAAPIAMTQAVLPEMLERGSGQIINISSVVGVQAIPRMTVYSATKSALTGFSTGLRMELRGSGVDVINVAPGSTRTDFFDAAAAVDVKAARFGKTQYSPERVARAVVRASRKRKRSVSLTVDGIAIAIIRRFSHRLADFIMYQVAKYGMPVEKARDQGIKGSRDQERDGGTEGRRDEGEAT